MSQILAPFQLLELNVISAQDLAPMGRNMRTYAAAYVHPDRKLSTRVDTSGHTNPTWNDKFVFRVDEEFLYADTSAIMIEIYALHWFKDIHVGTVRVLVGNLIPPPARPFHNDHAPLGMRFVALQVRRPSGRPQGILNIGVAVLDSSMRSMPLYTLNASAVGYRHLMGEADAYDSHNHLSPHVFSNAASSKPELRRTKSDTSSMIASENVARHQRAIINRGRRASSNISGSEVSSVNKKRNKKKKKKNSSSSQTSSIVSVSTVKFTSSALSDNVTPWKVKNGKTTTSPSDIRVEPPPPPFIDDQHNHEQEKLEVENVNHKENSSVNTISEIEINDTDAKEVVVHDNATPRRQFQTSPPETPRHFKNSPKPQYMNSPKPEYKNSPKPQYMNSPKPEYRNSPKPQYMNSPKREYMNSPKRDYMNSPKREYMNSPMREYRNSPMREFKNSPKPQYMKSPKLEYKNSPKPQYMKSPKPEYKNSPKPQYMESPMQEFRNSPKPQYKNSPRPEFTISPLPDIRNSPKPQFRNSPMPQFKSSPMPSQFKNSPRPQYGNSPAVVQHLRNTPVVSKFNPNRGYSSHRVTPLHQFGKPNTGFEYATPMRSNLARPVVMTESELGPSPSEVAAAMARKPVVEEENSTVGGWSLDESVEGLQSKLERWRTELPPVIDRGEFSSFPTTSSKTSRHSRRKTDGGGNGLFSCFSNICGVECSIVCGGDSKAKAKKKLHRNTSSADNTISLL